MPLVPPFLDALSASTIEVTSVVAGTPDTVLEVGISDVPAVWTGCTFTNVAAPGSFVQIFIGKEVYDSSSWVPVASIYLDGGEWDRWEGEVHLGHGDKIVVYADITARGTVTPEVGRLET